MLCILSSRWGVKVFAKKYKLFLNVQTAKYKKKTNKKKYKKIKKKNLKNSQTFCSSIDKVEFEVSTVRAEVVIFCITNNNYFLKSEKLYKYIIWKLVQISIIFDEFFCCDNNLPHFYIITQTKVGEMIDFLSDYIIYVFVEIE